MLIDTIDLLQVTVTARSIKKNYYIYLGSNLI